MTRRAKKRKLRNNLAEILGHTPNKRELRLYRDSGIVKDELEDFVFSRAHNFVNNFEAKKPTELSLPKPIKQTLWMKLKQFLNL